MFGCICRQADSIVEGGLVWRLVAVLFFRIFFRLMRIYTPNDTGTTVRIAINLLLQDQNQNLKTQKLYSRLKRQLREIICS